MERFAERLLERGYELARLLSVEVGSASAEAESLEVANLLHVTRSLIRTAPDVIGSHEVPVALHRNRRSELHYEPLGVVAVLTPASFPLLIPMGQVITAIIAGNAVVLKPSEFAPLIALRAVEWLEELGLPAGLVQVLVGGGATGSALVEAAVDSVVFIGSTEVGRTIATSCARRLLPCTLQLGGKGAAIVLPDADLDRTASGLVWASFVHSGQVCASVERVLVHRSQHDALVRRIVDRVRRLRHGDPLQGPVDVGAMMRPESVARSLELVSDAVRCGAVLETGGAAPPRAGTFFDLTVLSQVPDNARVLREEVQGPVLAISAYDQVDDAIRRVNAHPSGLVASVFGRDVERATAVAMCLHVGTAMVNDAIISYGMPETPWHGVKESGIGVTHAADGLRSMTRVLHVNTPRVQLPTEAHWFPYTDRAADIGRRALWALYGRGWRRLKPPTPPAWDPDTEWPALLPQRAIRGAGRG